MVPDINLLPQIDRPSQSRRWLSIIFGISFVFLLLFVAVQYLTLSKSVNKLQSEEQALLAEKAELESSVVVLEEPKQVDLATSISFVESVAYPVSPLLLEINKYVNGNTYLRNYVFSESSIQFSVDFETLAEVVAYVGDLAGSSYFQDVKVEQISTFDPIQRDEEEEKTDSFDEVERFSNTFTVIIDPYYLRTGGDVR